MNEDAGLFFVTIKWLDYFWKYHEALSKRGRVFNIFSPSHQLTLWNPGTNIKVIYFLSYVEIIVLVEVYYLQFPIDESANLISEL